MSLCCYGRTLPWVTSSCQKPALMFWSLWSWMDMLRSVMSYRTLLIWLLQLSKLFFLLNRGIVLLTHCLDHVTPYLRIYGASFTRNILSAFVKLLSFESNFCDLMESVCLEGKCNYILMNLLINLISCIMMFYWSLFVRVQGASQGPYEVFFTGLGNISNA